MNIIDAAHATVRSYPGGSESLGPRIGMSPAVLRNKVNPNNTTHHLTLAEADAVMGVSGDHRILHALAAEHGYSLTPIEASDAGCMFTAMMAASAAKGELAKVLADVMADKKVTGNEKILVDRACALLHAAIVQVSQNAAAAARAGQP